MRYLNYILLIPISLLSLLFYGCANEEQDEFGANGDMLATLTVDISSGGFTSKADNISSLYEDCTFKTLRIYAVDESGAVETNEYVDSITSSSENGLYYSFKVIQSPKKTLYVVVNEPSSLSSKLNEISRQSELTNLHYEIAEAINNEQFIAGGSLSETNRLLPMSAMLEVDASEDCKVVVNVDRVVARVDLMVDKDEVAYTSNVEFNSSTTVSVNGMYYDTSLFASQYLPTPTSAELSSIDGVALNTTTSLSLESDDRSSAKRLLSFYVAERTYNINASNPSENRIAINIDKIMVDGVLKDINSIILLGNNVQPYIEQINRNYVYKIYATYKGESKSLEVDDEYAIKDWTIEELDGDIEGVMISVANQVVMDWTRLNDSFTAKDIAFGSNRIIDIYVPSSYDVSSGEYEFKLCKFVAQAGVSYDLRDLSLYGVPDEENYLRDIPWLTRATIVFDSPQTGHFEFTYQLGSTPYYMDSVPLQLISANVRKQITLLYDNGYVPGDLLQTNDIAGCWGDAPNGIVFAKRGEALHPLTTEDILMYNSEGLYEGDIAMSASEADQYCKDKLGSTWYAPNKAQLADIQRHVLELGSSYRLNNAANAIYWSSEIDNGDNYWSINFEKYLNEPSAVSAPSATQHYVRCITNL